MVWDRAGRLSGMSKAFDLGGNGAGGSEIPGVEPLQSKRSDVKAPEFREVMW